MATACALRPAGRVTQVFSRPAEREAAFRFLENENTDVESMMAAASRAGVMRCAEAPFAYVPIDQSSLSFADRQDSKRLGRVGTRDRFGQGFEVTTPTVHQMVTWIAQLGGYTGKSSGGPPGALVIARGPDRIRLAVELLAVVEKT